MSASGQERTVPLRNRTRTSGAVRSGTVDEGRVPKGNLADGLKTPSGCKKGNVFRVDRAL